MRNHGNFVIPALSRDPCQSLSISKSVEEWRFSSTDSGNLTASAWIPGQARDDEAESIPPLSVCRSIDFPVKEATTGAIVGDRHPDDLGGGLFKKRLLENRYRSIILARAGRLWVYEYLFAKKDRANIDDDELDGFRKIAKAYCGLTDRQLNELIAAGQFVEICNDQQD